MPERDVPAPGLDWLAFQKRNKPPPLVYWDEIRPPRASKYTAPRPIIEGRNRDPLWNGKDLSPHPDSVQGRKARLLTKPKRRCGGIAKRMRKIRALDKICRYCMKAPAETADHVIPKSRGGKNTRLNLVGCCLTCNAFKADRTPKEAGMKLHLPLRFFTYIKEVRRFG